MCAGPSRTESLIRGPLIPPEPLVQGRKRITAQAGNTFFPGQASGPADILQTDPTVMTVRYWLMKTEPGEFSYDDLTSRPDQTEHWDGVRNYQARNLMRDDMRVGDSVFFYHSNCDEPGIVGLARIVREAYPDHTAFDPDNKHYDPKSRPDQPTWFMVDVQAVRKLRRTITLTELKACPELDGLALIRRGNRLSVMPVSDKHWHFILGLE
jgi:predicted RNA-binding protein with PUA-like domain